MKKARGWNGGSVGLFKLGSRLLAPDQRREAVASLSEKSVLALTMRLKWEGFSAAGGY